jgi:hypothetical protein
MYTRDRIVWRRLNMYWLALSLSLMLGAPDGLATKVARAFEKVTEGVSKTATPDYGVTQSEGGVDIPPK